MFGLRCRPLANCLFSWLLFSLVANFIWAQSETATVSGQVVDPSGLNVKGAQVKLVDIDRDTFTSVTTNPSGLYTFPSVKPGRYRMEVSVAGFKVVNVTGVTVNVQDHLEQNFKLVVGSVSESITVEGGAPLMDTESAAVSTVVDRNFAENLPMNGRSFQSLIQLAPGVVLTPGSGEDNGQFSVNGQRAASNYWMVDGVSANIGVGSSSTGNGFGGAVGSFSAQGGTNSLVSVDAMQEFRIQTSTYAPEFGRTPGGQISIVTRSGTNQFHGTVFDYFRNDVLDANDWFNGYYNPPLPKSEERQNDFGGTFSGPILKDRTFFFFSYEGLRLRVPRTALTTVPDLVARQNASTAMQPFLNAFPLPNGPEDPANPGAAQFNASFSNSSTLDAYSLRIDHHLSNRLTLFGRYNYSPSEISLRGGNGTFDALSVVIPTRITTQTVTVGTTWTISPLIANDLRFNYSRTNSSSDSRLDTFGGAVRPTSLPFPSPFTAQDANLAFDIGSLRNGFLSVGKSSQALQRQVNIVDNLSVQRGSHSLKFGVDFRRLTPVFDPLLYGQAAFFGDVGSAESGSLLEGDVTAQRGSTFLFRNLGVFAQDTWRMLPRLTLTYGLRWDVDFSPSSINGPSLPAVTGFNLSDLSELALAPNGTPPFKTPYGGGAPRLGVAYQISQSQDWQTVLRGGFGVFCDLATSEAGNNTALATYPFSALTFIFGGTFPFDPATAAPPPITAAGLAPPFGELTAFDPNLKLPYTLEWNVALEQALGKRQTISMSYIGAAGRRLIQSASITAPNANIGTAQLVTNAGTSDYSALQVQLQRRLSHGLQGLASYTWSHSIDTGSAGSIGVGSNALVPSALAGSNRGPSDFDVRNALSAGVTYDVPAPKSNSFTNAILRGWSLQNVIQARSAPPVNVYYSLLALPSGFRTSVRPDVVPGQPFYTYGSAYPGEKAFNPAAFTSSPLNPTTGSPLRQGDLGRNSLQGFGATQWDFAVHRDFLIHESLKLQFRAEMFNVLNHPNFGPPIGDLQSPLFPNPQFGLSSQTLNNSLDQNPGGGGFSPLYQIGGPRSIQFALKLMF
jgi:hypothetical protein